MITILESEWKTVYRKMLHFFQAEQKGINCENTKRLLFISFTSNRSIKWFEADSISYRIAIYGIIRKSF